MKYFLLLIFLFISACSKADINKHEPCNYTDEMVTSAITQEGNISNYSAERKSAEQGAEHVLKELITLHNGDAITIEHSYCYMYNYSLTYQVAGKIKLTSLVEALPMFDHLMSQSHAGSYLTEAFSEILLESLSMPQKMLKAPFSIGLPNSFTSSKENVEYSFEYHPINETNFGGEFTIYIGVGGL